MRKYLLTPLLLLSLSALGQSAAHCPARQTPVKRIQPNGDSVTVILKGDEHRHWIITTDGWQIRENKKGAFCYLKSTSDTPTRSSKITNRQAHDANHRTNCEQRWLTKHGICTTPVHRVPKRYPANWTKQQIAADRAATLRKTPMQEQETMDVGVRKTFQKIPVILVEFKDMAWRIPADTVDSMFNGAHFTHQGATGSVRQYFKDQSYGAYAPQFDIYGPVQLASSCMDYQGTANGGKLVLAACKAIDSQLDFSQYDLDENGKVDLVYILYAGPPSSDKEVIDRQWIPNPDKLIWPHYSMVTWSDKFDGKNIYDFEVSAELDGYYSNATDAYLAGIGLPCHEFGHGMGLPDIYNSQSGANVVYDWDIMDYGCYNNDVHSPAGYTALERWFMGWLTPTQISTADHILLPNIEQQPQALLICPSGQHNMDWSKLSPTDFYLLENRQSIGWDEYIPGHGLLISHVQYNKTKWNNNTVNVGTPLGFDIVRANGESSGAHGDDVFPSGAKAYTGISGFPIEDIKDQKGVISFQFMGGKHATPSIHYELEGAVVVSGPQEGDIETEQDITITLQADNGYETLTDDNCLYSVEETDFGEVTFTGSIQDGILTITIPSTSLTGALEVIVYGTESPITGWQQTRQPISTTKYIRNGRLFILRNGKRYNLLGIRQ